MAYYRNKHDKTGSASDLGENAENLFLSAAKKNNWEIQEVSKSDQFNHIDYRVQLAPNHWAAVEVKSRKRIKRNDKNVNDDLVWVEFKNVRGYRGWLYGKADFIAFERENDFLIVNRKLFARLCEKLCDLTKLNVDVKMPLYTAYQRKGRQDIVSLIKMSDITSNIKYSLLKK
jgi:hypothetical protein